ncbi:unnamed protein product [Mucor hiemalis]
MAKADTKNGVIDFSSPYTVHTLDEIPMPVLKLLVVLGPTLHQAARFINVIMWKTSQPRQSLLVILLWIMTCLWTWQLVAFGLPLLVVYKLGRDWLLLKTSRQRREAMEKVRQEQRRIREEKLKQNRYHDEEDDDEVQLRLKQQKEEEDELISRKIRPEGEVSLDDTLHDLTVVNAFIDTLVVQCKSIFEHVDGTRSDAAINVLSILLYVWPLWIVINWLVGVHGVFAVVGALLLASPSPSFQVVCMSLRRNIILKHVISALWAYGVALVTTTIAFVTRSPSVSTTTPKTKKKSWISSVLSRAKSEKSKALQLLETTSTVNETKGGTRSEMIFQFEVFENQRWWLGVNWTTNMMPSERGPWTDNQLKPISSKEEFELPEPTVKTTTQTVDNQVIERTLHKVWSWADGDWWVDMTGELQGKIDHNGWEYGNNAWKQLTGMPGIQTFTRRRRWCRRARLVEREIEQVLSNSEEKKTK